VRIVCGNTQTAAISWAQASFGISHTGGARAALLEMARSPRDKSDPMEVSRRTMISCLFCKIGANEVAAHEIYRDGLVVAFLDIEPINPGHTQLIPMEHFPYFEDLPPELVAHITTVGQQIASELKRHFNAPRAGFLFTGGDIAHAHAHVVPLRSSTDITSTGYIAENSLTFRSARRCDDDKLAALAAVLHR
jgi:histidine triad (HIT) family protein